jgi:hypothetical protein
MRKDCEKIQRSFLVVHKRVEECPKKDTNTVLDTEIEMFKKFRIDSRKVTPQEEMPRILDGIFPTGGNGKPRPPPAPSAVLMHPEERPPQPRSDCYIDFICQTLRNLGEGTAENRGMAILIADKEIKLDKAQFE